MTICRLTGVSMTGSSKTFWVECCYSRHWIHGPRREARVMALFPVKNGPQYRSENQYRGGFIAAFAPWLPEEGKPRLLYKPYRGRWMGSQSRLKWFRKHPSFRILFITWSSRRQIGQGRKKKRENKTILSLAGREINGTLARESCFFTALFWYNNSEGGAAAKGHNQWITATVTTSGKWSAENMGPPEETPHQTHSM